MSFETLLKHQALAEALAKQNKKNYRSVRSNDLYALYNEVVKLTNVRFKNPNYTE